MVTPLSATVIVRRLTIDIECKHTKFDDADDATFSRSQDISWGVKFKNWSRDPDHAHLEDSWSPEG